MLKSMLVVIDLSPCSASAIELGLEWAKALRARLTGLAVIHEPPVHPMELESMGVTDEQWLGEVRQKTGQLLEEFVEKCAETGVACEAIQEAGVPHEVILREAQRHDLILMGHALDFTPGLNDEPEEALWNVIKRESRPVAIAPAKREVGSSVVVAFNDSPQADRALQAFAASGLDFGEEVVVLCASTDQADAAGRAERAVDFLTSHGIHAVAHAGPRAGLTPRTILDEVRQRGARLLVMGAYGHSTVREFLVGSTTSAVLRDCPAAILLCH